MFEGHRSLPINHQEQRHCLDTVLIRDFSASVAGHWKIKLVLFRIGVHFVVGSKCYAKKSYPGICNAMDLGKRGTAVRALGRKEVKDGSRAIGASDLHCLAISRGDAHGGGESATSGPDAVSANLCSRPAFALRNVRFWTARTTTRQAKAASAIHVKTRLTCHLHVCASLLVRRSTNRDRVRMSERREAPHWTRANGVPLGSTGRCWRAGEAGACPGKQSAGLHGDGRRP